MPIEQTVYDLLAGDDTLTGLVSTRIFPTTPTDNTQLPFAVYTVSSTTPTMALAAPVALTQFTIDIDVWAVTLAEALAVLDAVKGVLHGHRGDGVQGCFLQTQGTDEQENGHHGAQTYSVWAAA